MSGISALINLPSMHRETVHLRTHHFCPAVFALKDIVPNEVDDLHEYALACLRLSRFMRPMRWYIAPRPESSRC